MTVYLPAPAGYTIIQLRPNGSLDLRESSIVGWAVSETNLDPTPIYNARGPAFQPVPEPPTSPYTPGTFLGVETPGGAVEAIRISQSVTVSQLFPGTRLPRFFQSRDAMYQDIVYLISRIRQPSDI